MEFKKCCAQYINAVWDLCGGPENIVRHESHCSVCNHYVGLTYTSKKDAAKFLKYFGLKLIKRKNVRNKNTSTK